MSNRRGGRAVVRSKKYWRGATPMGIAVEPPPIDVPAPEPVISVIHGLDDMALKVLRMLAAQHDQTGEYLWSGDVASGMGTSVVASRLGVRARTPERDRLNTQLTVLRKRGLLHFEYDSMMNREVQWWLTRPGLIAARDVAS